MGATQPDQEDGRSHQPEQPQVQPEPNRPVQPEGQEARSEAFDPRDERRTVNVTEFRDRPRKTTSWAGHSMLFSPFTTKPRSSNMDACVCLGFLLQLHKKQLSRYVAKRGNGHLYTAHKGRPKGSTRYS